MTPSVPESATFLAAMLRSDILPELTGFRAGNVGMAAAMLDMIAEEWDRTAARLVSENAAFRALLGDAPLAGLPDLRISALEAENDALRRRLIDRHAALENCNDTASELQVARIWDALRASVESRRLAAANF